MIRSPFFYVGDKYKLVPQLLSFFPKEIDVYVEPFYGGGSSMMLVKANKYFVNDIDNYVIKLHKFICSFKNKKKTLFRRIFAMIEEYDLSCSYLGKTVPNDIKARYKKTYYSVYNRRAYANLKRDFNNDGCKDMLKLYLLLIYGFNHMIRFNSNGQFNLPVGNVDFNKNVYDALNNYLDLQLEKDISYSNKDFEKFLTGIPLNKSTFVYLDPPYYISLSEYNKFWTERDEIRLYNLIDKLDNLGVKFGITNLLVHKGKTNNIFNEWSKKYKIETIKSNYISFNDNSIKTDSIELYVHN